MQWLLPLTLILVSLLAGVIFDRIFFTKLEQIAVKTKFPGNELVFEALHGKSILWFFLAGLYGAILSIPLDPDVSRLLQKLLTGIFLYTVTLVLSRLAGGFARFYGQSSTGILPSPSLLGNLAKLTVMVFGILMSLQAVGISITPILATLGIGGLAVALALQDTLSNLFSGLYLIISQQVHTGDYVKLETQEEGYVTDITWRNTMIREASNNLIIVPNTKLASAIFKNYHLPAQEIMLQVSLGVSYDSNLEDVEQLTLAIAREVMKDVPGGVPEFEPYIRYQNFEDFGISFLVFLRAVECLDQYIVKHEFIKRLHKCYREQGIRSPFPSKNVYLIEKDE